MKPEDQPIESEHPSPDGFKEPTPEVRRRNIITALVILGAIFVMIGINVFKTIHG